MSRDYRNSKNNEPSQLKKDLDTVADLILKYEGGSLGYDDLVTAQIIRLIKRLNDPQTYTSAEEDFSARKRFVESSCYQVLLEIATSLGRDPDKIHGHYIEVIDANLFAAALWMCKQKKINKLTINYLTSEDYFRQLMTATNITLSFVDLKIPDESFMGYLFKSGYIPYCEHLYQSNKTFTIELDAVRNSFNLKANSESSASELIVKGVLQQKHCNIINRILEAQKNPLRVAFRANSFHPLINIVRPSIIGIDLININITEDFLNQLSQIPPQQLRYLSVSGCSFHRGEIHARFIEIALKCENLIALNIDCVTMSLRNLLKIYLQTHTQLVESNIALDYPSIESLLRRNQILKDWLERLAQIDQMKSVGDAVEALKQLKREFENTGLNEVYQICFDRHARLAENNINYFTQQICLDDFEKFKSELNVLSEALFTFGLLVIQKKQVYQAIADRILAAVNTSEDVLFFFIQIARSMGLVRDDLLVSRFLGLTTDVFKAKAVAMDSKNVSDHLALADIYIAQYTNLLSQYSKNPNELDDLEISIIKCLSTIKPNDSQNYSEAEDKIAEIVKFKVRRILCGKPERVLSEFQNLLLKNLNANTTVGAMINSIKEFIKASSIIPFKYNQVDRKVIAGLEMLLGELCNMQRVDLIKPSAQAKENSSSPRSSSAGVTLYASIYDAPPIHDPKFATLTTAPPGNLVVANGGFGSPLHNNNNPDSVFLSDVPKPEEESPQKQFG